MGAFFICRHKERQRFERVKIYLQTKGLVNPVEVRWHDWLVLHFSKRLIHDQQVYTFRDNRILITGTLVYKGLTIKDSGKQLSEDMANNTMDTEALAGEYTLILLNNSGIEVVTAPSGIPNVYYSEDTVAISSSLLALKHYRNSIRLNKDASLETLLTGTLIGHETLYDGISRLTASRSVAIENLSLKVMPRKAFVDYFRGTRDQAVEYQLETLGNYFRKLKNSTDLLGVDSGLTSGFDSRLMLALMRKHWNKFQVHGHYREKVDKELEISGRLAEVADLSMVKVPVTDPRSKSPEELEVQFMMAHNFCDGMIRMHGYWSEEFNTAEHRIKVLNGKGLGVSGIGGEQYRNSDNLLFPNYGLYSFVKYRLVFNISGSSAIKNPKTRNNTIARISNKIEEELRLERPSKLSRLDIKRYWTELFIPGRLGGRNNSENTISYFVSPFAESSVSQSAYEIIPQLGIDSSFQMSMIKVLDPVLASVISDYGYPFDQSLATKYKIRAFLRGTIPFDIQQRRIDKIYNKRSSEEFIQWSKNNKFVSNLMEAFRSIELPVDEVEIMKRPDIMPLMLQLGYLQTNPD